MEKMRAILYSVDSRIRQSEEHTIGQRTKEHVVRAIVRVNRRSAVDPIRRLGEVAVLLKNVASRVGPINRRTA